MTSADLASWLLEQITEDERVARAITLPYTDLESRLLHDDLDNLVIKESRVLAECTAKRNIIEAARWYDAKDEGCAAGLPPYRDCGDDCTEGAIRWVLRHLAQPYADRPGYQEEWRP